MFVYALTASLLSTPMERRDAVFYRDRCRQEMGETVEQDPSKIPPPPMGE